VKLILILFRGASWPSISATPPLVLGGLGGKPDPAGPRRFKLAALEYVLALFWGLAVLDLERLKLGMTLDPSGDLVAESGDITPPGLAPS
jgi:hypothetical protein